MDKPEYHRYLASREWALLRNQVHARAGNRCERCWSAKADEVHHLTYERVGREWLEDLQALCSPCHRYVSAKSDVDPLMRRCTYFVAGPVEQAWHDEVGAALGGLVHLAFPDGDGLHEIRAHQVAANHRETISRCCGIVAMLDKESRVGTVCDLMYAVYQHQLPAMIVNRTGATMNCDAYLEHGMVYDSDNGSYTEKSPAWYLLPMLLGAPRRWFMAAWGDPEGIWMRYLAEQISIKRRACARPHMTPSEWAKGGCSGSSRFVAWLGPGIVVEPSR